ncbi:hypothetical protein ROZALSC1DRAFT_26208, partial [Rozella allomycis CSF55]
KATLNDAKIEQTSVNLEENKKSAKEPEGLRLIATTSNAEKTVEIKEDKVDERKSDEMRKYFEILQQLNHEAEIKVLKEAIFNMEVLERNEQELLVRMRNRLEILEQINSEAEEKVASENNFGSDIKMDTEEAIVKNSKSEGAVEVNEVEVDQDQKIISDSNELSQEIVKDEMN